MSKAQFRNCQAKRRFVSREEALAVAVDTRLGVYSCPACGGFHLTSQSRATVEAANFTPSLEKPTFDGTVLARARWKNS